MKKSIEFSLHTLFWVMFSISILSITKLSLQANPVAPVGQHISYVVFLELIMGLLFFYITFFASQWARRSGRNKLVLSVILSLLLIIFAIPATGHGLWEVLSSVVPHIILILMGFVFRVFSEYYKLENRALI
jgi:hypothetical protein